MSLPSLPIQYEPFPKRVLPFIAYFLGPYLGRWIAILFCTAYLGVFVALEPFILKLIVNSMLESVSANCVTKNIVIFIVIKLLHTIAALGIDSILGFLHPNIKRDLAAKLLNNLLYHIEEFYHDELSGSLSAKISALQNAVKGLLDDIRRTFRLLCEVIFVCIATAWIHPIYIVVVLGWSLAFVIIGLSFSARLNALAYKSSESTNQAFGKIVDIVSNVFTIKIFHRYAYENQYIYPYLQKAEHTDRAFRLLQAKAWMILDLGCLVLSLGVFGLFIRLLRQNSVVPGDFIFIVMVTSSLTATVFNMLEQFEAFVSNWGSVKQSLEVFHQGIDLKAVKGGHPLHVTRGEIEFVNVEFSYGDNTIFKNLNIKIQAEEKIGLVGVSGSGKSTCMKLLLRLVEPSSGKILIDGQDIIHASQVSIMESISFVNQDPLLFDRSIRENISYGDPHASEEAIIVAAQQAQIHHFITTLPEGYDSLVGEKGSKLSGGQRQRIAMARAFLKKAKILILDEATAALDTITEHEVHNSLLQLAKCRTSLIIAHRLSTVTQLDRILVFDKGKIVEEGTPAQLIAQSKVYKKLWQNSVDGLIPDNL